MSELSFPIKKSIYPAEILLKAAYSFIDEYYIHFGEKDMDWLVFVSAKDGTSISSEVQKQFENELISQTVRLNVYRRTHNIRELLLARAMASSMVDEGDSMGKAITDQQDISNEELKEILTDWFEENGN